MENWRKSLFRFFFEHCKNWESCPPQVTWEVKFKCKICLSCLSRVSWLSCLSCLSWLAWCNEVGGYLISYNLQLAYVRKVILPDVCVSPRRLLWIDNGEWICTYRAARPAKKVFLGYTYWTHPIIIVLLYRILIHPEVVTVDLYHGSLKWVQLLGLDLMRLNVANITSTRLSQSEQFRLQFSFLVPLNFTFLLLFFLWSTSLTTEPTTIISLPFGRAPERKYL